MLLAHLVLGASLALSAPELAQSKGGPTELYASKQSKLVLELSQRHLEYGLELRKQGLSTQAAAQIVLAAELGHGQNPGATQVLALMRQYDDAFWKRYGSKASRSKVEAYEKKSRALLLEDQKDHLELANWAQARALPTEAHAAYVELLLERDEPLVFDAKGQIVLPAGAIPKEPSERIRGEAVTINGALYVRDEILAKLPALQELFEVQGEDLRVRATTSLAQARELHALCSQLLPELERDLGARPERKLTLFVLGQRPIYESLLDALELPEHKIVDGIATPWPFLALVCCEGKSEEVTRSIALHELTHLYSYGVSRSAFPSWYAEGYADTFGGESTFTWDGAKLTVQGLLPRERIDALKLPGGTMLLRDMLGAEGLEVWKRGREEGLRFYAQSWCFLRYLRSAAPAEYTQRFHEWEERCRGQLLGVEIGKPRGGLKRPAAILFLELFSKDLGKLEDAFQAWLKAL